MRSVLAAALTAAALAGISCGGVVDPSKNVTDTFTGTIPVQGTASVGGFSTSKTGEYTIKVTTLTPNNGAFFGSILAATPTEGACSGQLQPIQQNSFGVAGTPILSGAIYPGHYCIFLFDVGAFTVPQTYTLTASHP
jgi:hypothetical protein